MASTVYLVRHGECKANLEEMNLPADIDVITDKGRLQASLLGKQFKEENIVFDQVYASTFSRALDTAKEILKELNPADVPEIQEDARIRERELGVFENRPIFDFFNAAFEAARERNVQLLDFECPEGEPIADYEARTVHFIEELFENIRKSEKPQTILVVTHGIVIMRLMLKLRNWAKDPEKELTLKNSEFKIISIPIGNTHFHKLTVDAPKDEKTLVIELTKLHEKSHLASLPKGLVKPNPNMDKLAKEFSETVNTQCTTH